MINAPMHARRRSVALTSGDRRRFLWPMMVVIGAAVALLPNLVAADDPPAPEPAIPTVEQILARHAEAIGGVDAWRGSGSRTARMRIEVSSQSGPQGMANEAKGSMVIHRKAPDRMVSTMTIEGVGEFRQGTDGTDAWTIGTDGRTRRIEGAELAERRREALFDRELRLGELYDRVDLVGERDFAGERCWLLRFTSKDGAAAQGWFSKERGLMRGFGRRLSSQAGSVIVVQEFDGYQDFGGRRVPTRISQTVGGTTQVIVLESIEDAVLDDALFRPPADLPPPAVPPPAPVAPQPNGAPQPPAPPADAPSAPSSPTPPAPPAGTAPKGSGSSETPALK